MNNKNNFSENSRFIVNILIAVLLAIVAFLTPQIQQLVGLEPSPLCVRYSCVKKYEKLIIKAKKRMSKFNYSDSVKVPLGVNKPIRLTEKEDSFQGWEAIGYVTQQGKYEPITPTDIIKMFDHHLNNIRNNQFSQLENKDREVLVAYIGNQIAQSSGQPVIYLIAYNTQTKTRSRLPNVLYLSFLKDALNAALNNEITTHKIDAAN